MLALTVWQPWASLIMAGAKPYEFRKWDFTEPEQRWRGVPEVGERIGIHAGTRKMRVDEIIDLMTRLSKADRHMTGLLREIAMPILNTALAQLRRAQRKPQRSPEQRQLAADLGLLERPEPQLPYGSILGTAIIGAPTLNPVVGGQRLRRDSDRLEHMNFGWPLGELATLAPPIPCQGRQGFWPIPRDILAPGAGHNAPPPGAPGDHQIRETTHPAP